MWGTGSVIGHCFGFGCQGMALRVCGWGLRRTEKFLRETLEFIGAELIVLLDNLVNVNLATGFEGLGFRVKG